MIVKIDYLVEDNSNLIITDKLVATIPEKILNNIYKIPYIFSIC